MIRAKRFRVERCDDGRSLVNADGSPSPDHTWDVRDRLTGAVIHNTDTRKRARDEAAQLEAEAERIAACPCAITMRCLCAGHARCNAPDLACDTTEVHEQNGERHDPTDR